MALILETNNFLIEVPEKPHVDRNEGGHVCIFLKNEVEHLSDLPITKAIGLFVLTMITYEAMMRCLPGRGIDLKRVNVQLNGNWTPVLHVHLYGRAKDAVFQKEGEALCLPRPETTNFYDNFQPLNSEDIDALLNSIIFLKEGKYSDYGLFL